MARSEPRRSSRAWLVLTMVPLLLGACGGGSTSSGTPTGPITFSMVGPLTGTYAENGVPILEGSKTAVKQINDAGGILGQKLKLDQADTVGDPGDAVPAVNKEISIGKPVALIGPITLEIHAVQPIFDRNQIVDGWNGGSTQFDNQTDKWLWRCNASDSELGVAMAQYAYEKGYKTGALFMSTAATAETLKPVIQKAFEALGGKMLGTVDVTPAQTSYRSEVQKVVNLKPDVIFTQLEPSTGAVAFANFRELDNLAIPFVGTDLTAGSDFYKAVGPAVAKQYVTSVQGSDALTATGKTFSDYYKQVNGHAPLSGSAYAYDCVIAFALAITKAGTADPKIWVNSIKEVTNPPGTQVGDYKEAVADIKAGKKINYEGASGPMDYDQYHNVTGAWDVVTSNGDPSGDQTVLETISADTIQGVVNKIK